MNTRNELDQNLLSEVVAESLTRAAASMNAKRWVGAITRATNELETNPYMTYERDSHSLLILSGQSGEIYLANGTCQCAAYKNKQPCWHRAAARLVTRCVEKIEKPQ